MTTITTMTPLSTDVVYLSIADAAADIEACRLSPVDLIHAVLDRIAATDDRLNSYVLVMRDAA